MAMRYSYELQANVYDRMRALESVRGLGDGVVKRHLICRHGQPTTSPNAKVWG